MKADYSTIKKLCAFHGEEYFLWICVYYHKGHPLYPNGRDNYSNSPNRCDLVRCSYFEPRCIAPKNSKDWKSYFLETPDDLLKTFYVEEIWHVERDDLMRRVYKRGGYWRKGK